MKSPGLYGKDNCMSKISTREVRHVAELARLEFSEDEIEHFTDQLNSILEYMEKLNELDTSGIEPTSHPIPLNTAWREDEARPGIGADRVTGQAPGADADFIVVPKVIE